MGRWYSTVFGKVAGEKCVVMISPLRVRVRGLYSIPVRHDYGEGISRRRSETVKFAAGHTQNCDSFQINGFPDADIAESLGCSNQSRPSYFG